MIGNSCLSKDRFKYILCTRCPQINCFLEINVFHRRNLTILPKRIYTKKFNKSHINLFPFQTCNEANLYSCLIILVDFFLSNETALKKTIIWVHRDLIVTGGYLNKYFCK